MRCLNFLYNLLTLVAMAFIRYLLLAAAIPAATTAESVEHIQDHAQKHQSTALPKHSSMSEVLHSFTLIDANADGMLSREELSQAIATTPAEAATDELTDAKKGSEEMMFVLQEFNKMRAEKETLAAQLAAGKACGGGEHHSHSHSTPAAPATQKR